MKTKARLFAVWLAVFMSFVTTIVASAASVSATVNVTVLATTPVVNSVSATDIYYGQPLSASTISGTMKNPYNSEIVTGTFKWTSSASSIPAAGSRTYNFTFTPGSSYSSNYTTATGSVTVRIKPCGVAGAEETPNVVGSKPHLKVGTISARNIVYGQSLSYSTITGTVKNPYTGNTVAGAWSWDKGSTIYPAFADANNTRYKVKFTPSDPNSYNSFYSYCKLGVDKRTPVLQSVNFSASREAETLGQVGITGNAIDSIEDSYIEGGTWSWQAPSTVLTKSASLQTYTYTPANVALYNSVTRTTTYGASELLPNAISIASQIEADYVAGGDFQLNATCPGNTQILYEIAEGDASVGSITVEPNGVVHINKVGETQVKVSTVGNATYQPYSTYTTVLIRPGDPHPVISASNIKYGEALTTSSLTTSNGTARWTTATTEYPAPGVYSRPVEFVPTDNVNYRNVTVNVNVTVEKADVLPTEETFTSIQPYGTSARYNCSDYTFKSAVTGNPVEGTYVFDPNTEKCLWLGESDLRASFTFKPTQANLYNDGVGQVKMVGEQVTPVATITETVEVPFGTTFGEIDLPLKVTHPDTHEDVPSSYLWADGASEKPSLGTHDYMIQINPNAGTYFNTITKQVSINVVQATAGITSIDATDIYFGQSLKDSRLSGDNKVAGTYKWKNELTQPQVSDANTTEYEVIFTPDDTTNYKPSTHKVTLNVLKSKPKIKSNTLPTLTYGQKMSELANTCTAHNKYTDVQVTGTWEWKQPDAIPTAEPTMTMEAVFHPTDTANYEDQTHSCLILVNKATPPVTITASPLTYGQPLIRSTLTVTGLEGKAEWELPHTVPTRGQSDQPIFNVIFTPTDYHNYKTVTIPTAVVVNKSDVGVANISATPITVGQTLGDSTLTWSSSIKGTLSWKASTTKPKVSDSQHTDYTVVFTPEDLDNYSPTEYTTQLVVRKCTPIVTETTLPTVEYYTKLKDISINFVTSNPNDSSPVPGTWAWEDPEYTPTVAKQSLGCIFTPTDTDNYSVVHMTTQKVTVAKADPKVTVTPSAIKYGQKLSDSYFTYEGAEGVATWTKPDTIPSLTDSLKTQYTVVFQPNDTANLNSVTIDNIIIQVNKYVPTEENAEQMAAAISVDPIPYGSKLSAATINGVENLPVAGTVRWANPDYKPSAADNGSKKYELIYTPTNNSDYTGGSIFVPVRVTPVDTSISNLSAESIIFGTKLKDVEIKGESSVPGTFSWETPEYAPTATDSKNHRKYKVVFTPTDGYNYNKAFGELEVPVLQANPIFYQDVLQSIKASDITFGQTLLDSQITGLTPCDGYYEWIRPTTAPTVADSDSTKYDVRFVSTDPSFVNDESLKLTVHVNRQSVDDILNPGGSSTKPTTDKDNDGVDDANDTDKDNDGVPNWLDPDTTWQDTDNDGIHDIYDTDLDGDGTPNDQDTDVNGVPWQDVPGYKDLTDTDGDSIPNLFDYDLDGDGIPNHNDPDINGQSWSSLPSDGKDTDHNGVPDIYDNDVDGDGSNNNDDKDYDGNGIPNSLEKDFLTKDTDGDGIPDIYDTDLDGDGTPNDQDTDVNGTPWQDVPGYSDLTDADNDGIPDVFDYDLDGDGTPNHSDPDVNGTPWQDIPGYKDLPDTDGNGVPDMFDNDIDGDGIDNNDDSDIDGDGIPNAWDPDLNWKDTDGDGIPDIYDTDIDGDGLPNDKDDDIDGDGVPNSEDPDYTGLKDTDGDGIPDIFDYDLDGDGIPNDKDDDLDGDGVHNSSDPDYTGLKDTDGDGVPDIYDNDMDGDGVDNNNDNDYDGNGTPNSDKATLLDTDGDGIPDIYDPDIDNDGIPNESDPDVNGTPWSKYPPYDKLPDENKDGIPDWFQKPYGQPPLTDTDSDGIPDIWDDDIDNDGLPNDVDSNPTTPDTPYKDTDGDGIPDIYDDDIDGDGKPNWEDDDVDGDGIPNSEDPDYKGLKDTDGDGIPDVYDQDIDGDGKPNDEDDDVDGDGIPNNLDRDYTTLPDTDKDGIPDLYDDDIDGDGIPNSEDDDIDGDGIPNKFDTDYGDKDLDGDGIPDKLDSDIDGDGIPNEEDPYPYNPGDGTTTKPIVSTSITYGQKLGDSKITGDTPIPGHFEWADPEIVPTVGDSYSTGYEAIFYPTDSENYNPVTGIKVLVEVKPAKPTMYQDIVQTIEASSLICGQKLGESTITGNTPCKGYYEWMRPTIVPMASDSDVTAYGVRFVSEDPNFLNDESITLTVHLDKYSYTVDDFITDEAPTRVGTSLTYSQKLSESTIAGETPIPGKFVWEEPDKVPTVADSETTTFYATFIPTDTNTYNSVAHIPAKVRVNKANIAFSERESSSFKASAITYGDKLSKSQISAITDIAGHFEWQSPDQVPTVAMSLRQAFRADFIPDNENYNVRKGIIFHVEIKPASLDTKDFSALKAEGITYGQNLSNSKITGSGPVAGKFEWTTPSTKPTVSDSNKTEYDVTFTPSDENYAKVSGLKCKIAVAKADVAPEGQSISLTATGITYGDKLEKSTIAGNFPIPGKYVWTNPELQPKVADSGKTMYNVKFIPESNNYNEFTGLSTSVQVSKKKLDESDFDKLKASDIGFGDALVSSKITADTPIDGTFTWNKPTYVPIRNDSDKTLFNITFTPTDTQNYDTTTLTIKVKIVDKELSFTEAVLSSIKASSITFGQKLSDSKITGKVPCDGYYEWMDGNIQPNVSDSNTTKYKVRFVSRTADYNNVENLELTVQVNKYTVTAKDIQNIQATTVGAGQPLSSSTLSASTTVPGKLTWTNPTVVPTMSDSSKTRYGVTFTPEDTKNYNVVNGLTTTVRVIQVVPDISDINLKASTIAYGDTLGDSAISGSLPINPYTGKEIPGQYKWLNTSTRPSVADSNITKYKVIFIPTDNNTYQNSSPKELTLNIVRNNPVLQASDIVANYGQKAVTLRITSNSQGTVTYTTPNTDIIQIRGNTATIVGTGTATVTAKVASTATFNEGTVKFNVIVNAGASGISGKTSYTVNYDSAPFKLDAKADNASMTLSYAVTKGNSVKVSADGVVTPVNAGVSIITIKASGAGYSAVPFTVQVTVNGKNQGVSTSGNITKVWGDAPFKLVANSTLGSGITYRSQNTSVITVSGDVATITGIGQATIVATASSNAGAGEASTTFVITVVKATPKVGQEETINKSLEDKPFVIEDTISSSGARTYKSTNPNVATVDRNGNVTIVGEGECKIEIHSAETNTLTEGVQYTTVTVSKNAGNVGGDGYRPSDNDDTKDTDGDGIPDDLDDDIDGDGIANGDDPTPNGPGGDGSTGGDDDDGNGGGNNPPFDPNNDTDGDGIVDGDDDDIDGDGIKNDEDDDVDGDGILNDDDPDYWLWKEYKDGLTHQLGDDDSNNQGTSDVPSRGPGNNDDEDDGNKKFPILPIAIGAGVLVLIAGAIITIVVIKKRKS